VTRVDVCLRFVLLEILRVCDSGRAQVGFLTCRADGSIIGVYPGEYYTWGFCNLVVNLGMHFGPTGSLSARW